MEENTTALALPNEQQFKSDIQAINKFQQIVHANMIQGHDFGVIPGTQKPTLLKPGAEKIAKLLGLSDQYAILDQQEDWQAGFFRYLVKCQLVHINTGAVISEGLGECNSMESKYRFRWVFASELPANLQGDKGQNERDKLASKMVNTKNGKAKMYRVDNEDIFSQVNTILKMAKKRALVDASLSAGRLSDVFTQDIEDMGQLTREEPVVIEQPKSKATTPAPKPTESVPKETPEPSQSEQGFDADWLTDSLKQLKWQDTTVKSYLKNVYHVDTEGAVVEVVAQLTREQQEEFFKEVQNRLQML